MIHEVTMEGSVSSQDPWSVLGLVDVHGERHGKKKDGPRAVDMLLYMFRGAYKRSDMRKNRLSHMTGFQKL